MTLSVGGHVEKFASITPKRVRLKGHAGQPIKTIVKIIPQKKYPFKITGPEAITQKHIRYILQEVRPPQGTGYILSVENMKKEKGRYYEVISLKTDSNLKPLIKIGVMGNILGPKQRGQK